MVFDVHAQLRMLGFVHICFIFLFTCFHFFGGTAYSKLRVPDLNRDGWERRILLRSVPFGISSEALIGCGQFLCLGFRFSFLSLMIQWMHLGLLSQFCQTFWCSSLFISFSGSDNYGMARISESYSVTWSNNFWGYSEYFHYQCSTSSYSRLMWIFVSCDYILYIISYYVMTK
jgi:hypothetical protein